MDELMAEITKSQFDQLPDTGRKAFDGSPIRSDPDCGEVVWEDGHGAVSPIAYVLRNNGLHPAWKVKAAHG